MAVATALALGGAAALAGGIGNYLANSSAADRAQAIQNQALQEWLKVQIPDPAQQKLALQQFVLQGKLDPKLESAIQANPSQFQKIVTNPTYNSAKLSALNQLQQIGNQGGLRLQDRAALQDAQQQSIDKERGDRMAIQNQMAQRGLGGSGFDVAAQLQAQQSGADRNAQSSLDVAAQAQNRALQSIQSAGDMASKFQGQDFDQAAQRAAAEDRINLFNTQNMQDVQQRNTSAQNQAQYQNLSNQQKIADQNVQQNNYQQEYNKKLAQQQFDNQSKLASGMAGQYGNLANIAQTQGQNLGNLYSNMGSGASGAASSYANYDLLNKYLKNKGTAGGTPPSFGG
jgi:hypothetical protein